MSIEYFYSVTPRQFDNILAGHARRKEGDVRVMLTMVRDLKFCILKPYLKNENVTAEQLFPFPWDKRTELIDAEEEMAAVERQKDFWMKMDEKRKSPA